jgi:PPM family protein phosphatase
MSAAVISEDCPSCADERAAGAAFCEACGRALTVAPPVEATAPGVCPHCGTAGAIGADGYCGNCGMLAFRPRDHIELDAGQLGAAVTDRGLRHHRNEDAMFLAARGADVDVVVCDGVSASFDPDVASAIAAETAGVLLISASPTADGALSPDDDRLGKQIGVAVAAAGAEVAALAASGDPRRATSNPACTIVAACVRGSAIGYGWIGDSRAYWLPAEGPAEQLTEDDSWAAHAIAEGADPHQAMRDPKAHAITAWLGADAGPLEARTGRYTATAAGHLVVCSDGLWNYLADPADFADAVRKHLRDTDPLTAARSLTAFANECGGADNITVALIPVVPAAVSTAVSAAE